MTLYCILQATASSCEECNLAWSKRVGAFLFMFSRGRIEVGHFVWELPPQVSGFNSDAPV